MDSMYNWNVPGVNSKLGIDLIFIITCLQTIVWAKHVRCSASIPKYRCKTTVVLYVSIKDKNKIFIGQRLLF